MASKQTPIDKEQEARWIRRSQLGDRVAFGLLVEAHRAHAYAAALSIVRNEEDARDLSQDAFVKAFNAIGRFEVGRSFYSWYYRILRNLCLTHLEKHGNKRKVSLDAMLETNPGATPAVHSDVAERIQAEQMSKHLRAALDELSPEFREIIFMQTYEDMSYKEIALALRIPIGTVMSRLFNARLALKEKMEKHRVKK